MKLSKEIKTGILVAISIGILIYGFNFLKGKNLFIKKNFYYAVYPSVGGLVIANPIQVNGFKVGHVQEMRFFDSGGRIIVTMNITDSDLKIKKGSVAKIVSSDLLGSKAVDIILGQSNETLKSGDTLMSDIEASLQQQVDATVRPLKEKAQKLIESIDSILTVVHAVLGKNTRENLNKSFESVRHAIETFDKTSMRLDTLIATERHRISNIFSKIESISTNLANNNEKISKVIKNFSSISDTLAKANILHTIENVNLAFTQVSDVMEKINKGKGTAGMLIHDDALYKKLTSASGSLDSLLIDMKNHPKKYFSIFGKDKKK
ncbi:MAG: MlaD family protein [Bacteroidota bacterium]